MSKNVFNNFFLIRMAWLLSQLVNPDPVLAIRKSQEQAVVMMNNDLGKPVVIDAGDQWTKVGFSGESEPISVFPTILGYARKKDITDKEVYVGDETNKLRGILAMRFPLERGVPRNYDFIEKIWHYSFYNKLRVPPEDHPVLLSELPLASNTFREKTLQIMFETFMVQVSCLNVVHC
jgi:actin-related protein